MGEMGAVGENKYLASLPPLSTDAPENLDGALASTSVNLRASRFDSTSLSVQTRSGEMSACKATLGGGWVGVCGGVWGCVGVCGVGLGWVG